MPAFEIRESREALGARLNLRTEAEGVVLHWLGQAGFLIESAGRLILIDPYLSDTLGAKYRATATPHERMTPPPIAIADLGRMDLVLVTHHHTDHMDPGTLAPLAQRFAETRFVVPRAAKDEALRRIGVAPERLILMDAGEVVSPWQGLRIAAIRASHETLEVDAAGCHRFLGYGLTFEPAITVVHTGDTIPFAGQVEEVAALRPDLVLAPVNGRSADLLARGVPGNMTLDEAVDLTAQTGAPAMVAHHHGMFAFNTLPLPVIEAKAAEPDLPIRLIPARLGLEVRLQAFTRRKDEP